MVTPLGE